MAIGLQNVCAQNVSKKIAKVDDKETSPILVKNNNGDVFPLGDITRVVAFRLGNCPIEYFNGSYVIDFKRPHFNNSPVFEKCGGFALYRQQNGLWAITNGYSFAISCISLYQGSGR